MWSYICCHSPNVAVILNRILPQRFYVMTSNQLRRLMNVRTSPMYSHFGETVAGASSIRAYHRQEDFIEDSDRRLDEMQMARYPATLVNRWGVLTQSVQSNKRRHKHTRYVQLVEIPFHGRTGIIYSQPCYWPSSPRIVSLQNQKS